MPFTDNGYFYAKISPYNTMHTKYCELYSLYDVPISAAPPRVKNGNTAKCKNDNKSISSFRFFQD